MRPVDTVVDGDIADCFAGPGGWSEALRLLGLADIGYEWDDWACATRAAAGHRTIQADVAQVDLGPLAGSIVGLIGSPPCQLWSTAGKKAGRNALDILIAAMRRVVAGDDCRAEARLEGAEAIYDAHVEGLGPADLPYADEHAEFAVRQAYNACLVLEPARWAYALNPEWVALEQVPAVLPLWEVLAAGLRKLGYSTWTGILNSADFGVPQTRRRAFLMASRVRTVHPPEPTHARVPVPSLFGEPEKWVSMAAALGWGMTDRAAFTFAGGNGGGPDYLGGSGARAAAYKERDEGRWIDRRTNSKGPGWRDDPKAPMVPTPPVPDTEPAPTVTGNVGSWVVNTGRDWKPGGTREDAQTVDCAASPAPTVTSRTGRQWQLHERRNDQSQSGESDPEWPFDRPATTIAGRPLVPDPGTNANRFNGAEKSRNDGYRINIEEAAVLQSFEPDYPFQGNASQQFLQVGNCVPPRMAVHVLAAVMGLPVPDFATRVTADA